MAIGFYIFITGLVYVASLALLARPGHRGRFSAIALPLAALGLVMYVALSNLVGVRILSPGQASSYSIPEDYLAVGAAGWTVMERRGTARLS